MLAIGKEVYDIPDSPPVRLMRRSSSWVSRVGPLVMSYLTCTPFLGHVSLPIAAYGEDSLSCVLNKSSW